MRVKMSQGQGQKQRMRYLTPLLTMKLLALPTLCLPQPLMTRMQRPIVFKMISKKVDTFIAKI